MRQATWTTRSEWFRSLAARPVVWLCLTATIGLVDYLAGPHVHAGLLYLLPLALTAWYGPLGLAVAIAVILPAVRLSYFVFDVWDPSGQFMHVVVNAAVRVAALTFIAVLINRARRARELEREVTTLRGLLPICMYCKRIEDAAGHWQSVEEYVGARSEAAFTHRVCPFCTNGHRRAFLGGK